MESRHIEIISKTHSLAPWQVENTLRLLQDGATIPFISRYRKEATGSLDETQVSDVRDQHTKLVEMDKRRETILKSIEEQGKLTDDLKRSLRLTPRLNLKIFICLTGQKRKHVPLWLVKKDWNHWPGYS
jgi:uncharacterized protein